MHAVDWDSLFQSPSESERDATVAFLYHYAEELIADQPLVAFHLRRVAESIVKGKHVGN